MKIELPALQTFFANRQDVLDALCESRHDFAHLLNFVFGQMIEALLRQHFATELLHVIVVLLLQLALGEIADRAADRLHQLADQLLHLLDAFFAHPHSLHTFDEAFEILLSAFEA